MAAGRLRVVPYHRHPRIAEFRCGTPQLDEYLKTLAGQQHRKGIARVFLAQAADNEALVGYYSLSR